MKDADQLQSHSHAILEGDSVDEAVNRVKGVLDAECKAADLNDAAAQCTHLNSNEQLKLKTLLEKFKELFDGTLGHWKNEECDIELRPDAEPHHARACPMPEVHKKL